MPTERGCWMGTRTLCPLWVFGLWGWEELAEDRAFLSS